MCAMLACVFVFIMFECNYHVDYCLLISFLSPTSIRHILYSRFLLKKKLKLLVVIARTFFSRNACSIHFVYVFVPRFAAVLPTLFG